MNTILKVLRLFKGEERLDLYILASSLLLTGLLEVVSLGLIFPFIGLATQPTFLEEHIRLSNLLSLMKGIGILVDPLILIGVVLVFLFVLKFVLVLYLTGRQYRIIYANQVTIAGRLLQKYLDKDYSFFSSTNSSIFIRNLTVDTSQVANGVLVAALTLFSEGVMLIGLLMVLLIINYQVVLVSMTVLLITLFTLSFYTKSTLIKEGSINRELVSRMIRVINHSIGAIKDIKILSLQGYFLNDYRKTGKAYVQASSRIQVITQLPRLVIELMIVSFVVGAVLFLRLKVADGLIRQLPVIAIFGTVLVRMMPSMNRMMSSINGMKQHHAALENILNELEDTHRRGPVSGEIDNLNFVNSIELRNIDFQHPGTSRLLFENFSFTVRKHEMLGIIGASGSGKSTLVEILLGLLKPQNGNYIIDGIGINPVPGMYGLMGYVQQSVFLVDGSIRENIVLGREFDNLDKKLGSVINDSRLNSFIAGLPDGIASIVGERGALISGGQKQRIGIARALIGEPSVLIFDESTSALDYETETSLIEMITENKTDRTIIMVAHRLQSLKSCDRIVRLEEGRIVFEGTFQELQIREGL